MPDDAVEEQPLIDKYAYLVCCWIPGITLLNAYVCVVFWLK